MANGSVHDGSWWLMMVWKWAAKVILLVLDLREMAIILAINRYNLHEHEKFMMGLHETTTAIKQLAIWRFVSPLASHAPWAWGYYLLGTDLDSLHGFVVPRSSINWDPWNPREIPKASDASVNGRLCAIWTIMNQLNNQSLISLLGH